MWLPTYNYGMDPQVEDNSTPGLEEWLGWSRQEVSGWVRSSSKPLVLGWPFNGTRRWYLLHSLQNPSAENYARTVVREQAERQCLLFELGASAILAPCFGYELLGRGEEYTYAVAEAVFEIGNDPINQAMFERGVRLRVYGDYEQALDTPRLRPMLHECHRLMERTAGNGGPLLLLGLFADSPHERIARISIDFYKRLGRAPDRRELIREYYGVEVPDLSLYIGFAQPALFDVPLITTGEEDLYATLAPSPEVTERQLREILYDHLVLKRMEDVDYESFSEEAIERLREYSEVHREQTLGVGRIDPLTGMWNPLPSALATSSR